VQHVHWVVNVGGKITVVPQMTVRCGRSLQVRIEQHSPLVQRTLVWALPRSQNLLISALILDIDSLFWRAQNSWHIYSAHPSEEFPAVGVTPIGADLTTITVTSRGGSSCGARLLRLTVA